MLISGIVSSRVLAVQIGERRLELDKVPNSLLMLTKRAPLSAGLSPLGSYSTKLRSATIVIMACGQRSTTNVGGIVASQHALPSTARGLMTP